MLKKYKKTLFKIQHILFTLINLNKIKIINIKLK